MIDISVLATTPDTVGWPDVGLAALTVLLSSGLAIAGSIWGARIGAKSTATAAAQQITAADAARAASEDAEVDGFLKAVRAELTTALTRYNANLGNILRNLEPGQFLNTEWPIRHNYLVIYDANARLIGRIRDPETRTLIVQTYTHIKGLLDSLSMNTQLLREMHRSLEEAAGGHIHSAPFHHMRARELQAMLISYADGLRALDELALACWRRLEPRLPAD